MTTDGPDRRDVSAGQGLAVPLAEAVFDLSTGRWSWAPAMYELLGVADDGGDPAVLVFARMHPDDAPRIRAVLDAVAADPGPFAGQYRVRDDRGRERVIAFLGDAERDASGVAHRLRGMAFDVTDAVRLAAREAVLAATADRAAVEQVKGALMYAHGLDADAAFGLLTRLSQRANVKVSVLAERTVGLLASRGDREPSVLALLEAAGRPGAGTGTDRAWAAGDGRPRRSVTREN